MSSRFPIIDPQSYPPVSIIDIPDEEAIITARMTLLKERWEEYDPPFGALYDTENLEFDPLKINQEVATSFEVNARNFVNQMGRATSLAHASGSDLDVIASRYPALQRLPLTPTARPYATNPEDWEADLRFKRRIILSMNAFNSAGAEDAYVYWALTTDVTLRDATAIVLRPLKSRDPIVIVTLLGSIEAPAPTHTQIEAVRAKLHQPDIKPLTDVVQVRGPAVKAAVYDAGLWLYPGVSSSLTLKAVEAAVDKLIDEQYYLDMDATKVRFEAALGQRGVQNAETGFETIAAGKTEVVKVTRRDIRVIGRAE